MPLYTLCDSMKNRLFMLLIILGGVFWGSSCLFVDKLYRLGFSPFECTAIRLTLAAIILNLALIIKNKGFKAYKIGVSSYLIAASSGIFSVFAMCAFYYLCMEKASAAVSAILLYTAPLFVMIMSLILFKEKLTAKKITAFIIAIIGCALVSGIASGISSEPIGILFGIFSGFTYSLYGIFTHYYMKKNSDTLTFTALNFLFGSIFSLFFASPEKIIDVTVQNGHIAETIIYFAIFGLCTAVIPFTLYTLGLKKVKPDTASILAFTEPLTAAIFGILILNQNIDIYGIVGIILVTAAIVLMNIQLKSKKRG